MNEDKGMFPNLPTLAIAILFLAPAAKAGSTPAGESLFTRSHAPENGFFPAARAPSEFGGEGGVPANVFNNDNRRKLTNTATPWSAVGRLNLPNGGYCTASLVGANLILTAAHCIINKGGRGNFIFYPGYTDGAAKLSSTVNYFWWGTTDPDAHRDQDWAILRLNEPLGNAVGWFGTESRDLSRYPFGTESGDISRYPAGYYMAGYSGDFDNGSSASWGQGCSFTGRDGSGYFTHNCDSSRGASGGPMFYFPSADDNRIVAVNVAERRDGGDRSLIGIPYSDHHANVAVPATMFVPTLLEILGR